MSLDNKRDRDADAADVLFSDEEVELLEAGKNSNSNKAAAAAAATTATLDAPSTTLQMTTTEERLAIASSPANTEDYDHGNWVKSGIRDVGKHESLMMRDNPLHHRNVSAQVDTERMADVLKVNRIHIVSNATRTFFALCAATLAVLLRFHLGLNLNKCLSILCFCVFVGYFLKLFATLARAKYIWRMISVTRLVKDWIPIPVTFEVLEDQMQSIQSISEMSAIHGASAGQSLTAMTQYMWSLFVIYILLHSHYPGFFLQADVPFATLGAFGIFIIGIWDINPFSFTHQCMHYVGTVLSLCAYVAVGIQEQWQSPIAFALIIVGVSSFVLFMWRVRVADKYSAKQHRHMNIETVTRNSLWCIFFESVAIITVCCALAIWLFRRTDTQIKK